MVETQFLLRQAVARAAERDRAQAALRKLEQALHDAEQGCYLCDAEWLEQKHGRTWPGHDADCEILAALGVTSEELEGGRP